jgi:hypothetical protein
MKFRLVLLPILLSLALLTSGCSKSNNLLLGRVEAMLGSHLVVVTDCYRTSVPPPQLLIDSDSSKPLYRFEPCLDADIVINGNQLIINGKSYGSLGQNDTVTVDHGKVLINDRPARISHAADSH